MEGENEEDSGGWHDSEKSSEEKSTPTISSRNVCGRKKERGVAGKGGGQVTEVKRRGRNDCGEAGGRK